MPGNSVSASPIYDCGAKRWPVRRILRTELVAAMGSLRHRRETARPCLNSYRGPRLTHSGSSLTVFTGADRFGAMSWFVYCGTRNCWLFWSWASTNNHGLIGEITVLPLIRRSKSRGICGHVRESEFGANNLRGRYHGTPVDVRNLCCAIHIVLPIGSVQTSIPSRWRLRAPGEFPHSNPEIDTKSR